MSKYFYDQSVLYLSRLDRSFYKEFLELYLISRLISMLCQIYVFFYKSRAYLNRNSIDIVGTS